MKRSLTVLTIALLYGCAVTPPASTCKELQGVWEGQMKPGGPLVITFDDACRYTWTGAVNTAGHLATGQEGQFMYSNEAGSRGTVTYSSSGKRTLIWRNIYTGNWYSVEVTKK